MARGGAISSVAASEDEGAAVLYRTTQELEIRTMTARAEALDPARRALAREAELAGSGPGWRERVAPLVAVVRARVHVSRPTGQPREAVRPV